MNDAAKIVPKRILIADGVPGTGDLVRSILGRSRYEVFESEDGKEARACAARVQPDLVILDLQVSKPDGCSVASRLRSMPSFEGTPILALSLESHRQNLQSDSGRLCLAKPISPARLRSAVTELFGAVAIQKET